MRAKRAQRQLASGCLQARLQFRATRNAPLAQLAEHLTLNQAVEGSIPSRRISNMIHGIWAGAGIGRQDRLRIYWGYAS